MSDIPTYDFKVVGSDCLRAGVHLVGPGAVSLNLSGHAAELELRFGGGSVVITEPDLAITPLAGTIETTLEAALIATLPLGRTTRHRWTLIEPGGCRRSVLQGYIERS